MTRLNRLNKLVNKEHVALTLLFSLVVFCLLLLSLLLAGGIIYLLMRMKVLIINESHLPEFSYLLRFLILGGLGMGILLAIPLSRYPLKPFNRLINCINLLAAGNFNVRLSFGAPITKIGTFAELSESFNKLASELESTEMLRRDFINNFSHEFKTPIVSIAGFAKLLKRGNLSEEQKTEYLNIIEEESLRLSYMATNVLNLTHIENQSILSDVSQFNLSEQLRSCILLLEGKWSKKNIQFNLNFDEYSIMANEELLKQVWINLIDNAIKFSQEDGTIVLDVTEKEGTGTSGNGGNSGNSGGNTKEEMLLVSITNEGPDIPPEKQQLIFNKFYQVDESHASEGNGVGLAIVKMISVLHGGTVHVKSGGGKTTFTVQLPQSLEEE